MTDLIKIPMSWVLVSGVVVVFPFTLTPRPADPESFNGIVNVTISLFLSVVNFPSSPACSFGCNDLPPDGDSDADFSDEFDTTFSVLLF